jgi:hypothetical protein
LFDPPTLRTHKLDALDLQILGIGAGLDLRH